MSHTKQPQQRQLTPPLTPLHPAASAAGSVKLAWQAQPTPKQIKGALEARRRRPSPLL